LVDIVKICLDHLSSAFYSVKLDRLLPVDVDHVSTLLQELSLHWLLLHNEAVAYLKGHWAMPQRFYGA